MKKKQTPVKVEPLLFATYLACIKNSEGSSLFRNFYARVDGRKTDIMRRGELACAFYVSSILKIFSLVKDIHTTVTSTVKDLKTSGWTKVDVPRPGCVLVWEEKEFENNEKHTHIGFYLEKNKAISNSEKHKVPTIHHWTWNGTRKIEDMYWRSFNETADN